MLNIESYRMGFAKNEKNWKLKEVVKNKNPIEKYGEMVPLSISMFSRIK
jgi:acetone carboxylase gamma subunit